MQIGVTFGSVTILYCYCMCPFHSSPLHVQWSKTSPDMLIFLHLSKSTLSLYVFLKTHFLVSFSYNHLLIRRIKVSQFEFLRKGWQLNTLPWLCVFDSCLCLNLKIFFRLEMTFNTEVHGYFFLLPLLSYYFLNLLFLEVPDQIYVDNNQLKMPVFCLETSSPKATNSLNKFSFHLSQMIVLCVVW